MSISEDFKKPINLIFLTLTVISLAATVVFYYKSKREMRPTYSVPNPALRIFDSNISSPKIRLQDSTGRQINEDVYLAETVFWNSGQLPIEPSDVREPVTFSFEPCSRILDWKITGQTKPEISQFALVLDTSIHATINRKTIVLKWSHLDPNFGARIQVIYSSAHPAQIAIGGYIAGVQSFTEALPKGQKTGIQSFFEFILAAGSLIVVVLIGNTIDNVRKKKPVPLMAPIILAAYLVVALVVAFVLPSPLPPV
jgi:hypothetical protein